MPLARRLAPLIVGPQLILCTAAPALAQDLTGDERVVDEAGVLTEDQRAEALDAIEDLEESENVELWALFVSTTSGEPADAYTQRVAEENSLGVNDALLMVAVDDRRYQLWIADPLEAQVSPEEQAAILAEGVEPNLQGSAWGAAVAAAADGLGEAVSGDAAPDPGTDPGSTPGAGEERGSSGLPFLIALALIGGGAWLIWNWIRSRRAVAAEDRERTGRLTRLAQETNALLIETDELLRHNGQELGFVEAEFGAEAAEPFRTALLAAREELQAAFRVRQRLDDNQPETPPQREQLLNEIRARCTKARQLVEAQTARFRELRDLERRAPDILGGVDGRVAEITGRIPAVESALASLRAEASGSSQAVHGNVIEARKRLELASRTATEGRAALDRGDGGSAARAAKAAQDALAQAAALLDAIEHEAQVLDEARTSLSAALARARADVDAAAAAVSRAPNTDQRDELAAARAKLAAAEAAVGGDPHDLVLAYRLAREAEAAADEVVAQVAEGEERRARARAGADAAIRAAELQVDRAEEYISARRHGVGRRPRTALSEADAALTRAMAVLDHDPAAATSEARRAAELAEEAYRRARADFSATETAGYGGTVIINGRPYRMGGGGWGNDVGGAVIGGIIGSILSGGGRGGWGGGFGGGGFGGFGGGGGGFGGGRSFGGGFGGGGGRSMGGGW